MNNVKPEVAAFVRQAQQGICQRYNTLLRVPLFEGRWLQLGIHRMQRVRYEQVQRCWHGIAAEHQGGDDGTQA